MHNKQHRIAKKQAKEKRKKSNKKSSTGPVFVEINNPFARLSIEDRDIVVKEIGVNSRINLENSCNRLIEIVCNYNPFLISSTISICMLTRAVKSTGIDSSDAKFLPSHLEFFQAVGLTIPEEKLGSAEPPPDVIQEVIDGLLKVFTSFSLSRYDKLLNTNESERAMLGIQERLRAATQFVRNWGAHSKIIEISRNLYGKFDSKMYSEYGFTVTECISVFQALVDQFEDNLNADRSAFFQAASEKQPELIWRKHAQMKGYPEEEILKIEAMYNIKSLKRKDVLGLILNDHQRYFGKITEISIPDIEKRTGIGDKTVGLILNEFSLGIGALCGSKIDHLFLDNPIWKKPIIKIGDTYQNANPYVFFSHIKPVIEERLRKFADVEISDHRSDYLESEVLTILKSRFPDSWIQKNFKWQQDNIQYENDLVVAVDSHFLIFECKSHKIHDAALRGGPKKIESVVDDIISDSAIQSWRLKNKLLNVIAEGDDDDKFRQLFPHPINGIYKILRISITLDDFILTSADYNDLILAGWLPANFKPCPNISLADFQLIAEILENPVHLIHYLERRSEISENSKLHGDEIDFLGTYLKTSLNYDGIPIHSYGKISLSGMSSIVMKYFESADAGISIKKPSPAISKLFESIIQQLSKRKSQRWTEIGCMLCGFLPEDQRKIENKLRQLTKIVRKTWKDPDHKNALCYVPPTFGNTGFCYIMCTQETWENRTTYFDAAKNTIFSNDRVKLCIAVIKNIDNTSSAYDYLLVMSNSDFNQRK